MPDKFPEAFHRFENDVYVKNLRSFQELISSFAWWSGGRWRGSTAQIDAIAVEGEKLGFDTSLPSWVKKSDYRRFYARGYGRRASVVYEKRARCSMKP